MRRVYGQALLYLTIALQFLFFDFCDQLLKGFLLYIFAHYDGQEKRAAEREIGYGHSLVYLNPNSKGHVFTDRGVTVGATTREYRREFLLHLDLSPVTPSSCFVMLGFAATQVWPERFVSDRQAFYRSNVDYNCDCM